MAAARRKAAITIIRRQRTGFRMPTCDDEVESLFDQLIHRGWGSATWRPDVDVVETGEAFVVTVDLPGVAADSMRLIVEEYRITVDGDRPAFSDGGGIGGAGGAGRVHVGERPRGRFARTIEFNAPVDPESLEMNLESGVLRIVVAKIHGAGSGGSSRSGQERA